MRSLLLLLGVLVLGCGTSPKTTVPTAESKMLDEMVFQNAFQIESDWAMPLMTNSLNSIANSGLFPPGSNANRITLVGNDNYLKVNGDSISVYLPYFGERQMGGGYNSDGSAIQFKGIPEDYRIVQNKRKKRREIRFKMKKNTETFVVTVMLFPNLTSNINVNSSHRFPISYSGTIAAIPEEQ
ncbi:MAG: DUF4251 domain-containing protein [Saonia sp.]